MSVQYEGDHISGSPFNIKVFDPNAVRVFGLEGGTVGMGLNFTGMELLTINIPISKDKHSFIYDSLIYSR